MPDPDFWTRMKEARIVPVLLLYLGVAWGILLLVNLLQDRYGLPGWMDPVAFILLLMGLIIITATALVLSQPRTRERRAAGELPGDWEVAPQALLGEMMVRGVPQLTWGRSILGGVFALGLMFALAAVLALIAGPSEGETDSAPPEPTEAYGDPALREPPAPTEAHGDPTLPEPPPPKP